MPKRKYTTVTSVNKHAAYMSRLKRRRVGKATKALSEVKKLKKVVNKTMERYNVTYRQPASTITSGGINHNGFLYVGEGSGDGAEMPALQRKGDSICLLSQRFNANLTVSGTDNYNQIRLLLVESVDGNTALALSDVLEYSSYSLHGALVFVSPKKLNPGDGKRYKVHFDRTFEMSAIAGQGSSGKGTKQFKVSLKYGKTGKVLKYASSAAVQPMNHRLHLFAISDSSSVTHPDITYSMRSTYRDS